MQSILVLMIFLQSLANSKINMAIVWGKPLRGDSISYSNITNWSDCVQFCFDAKYCVAAYNRGYDNNAEGCEIYEYKCLKTVQQLTKETALGAKVAFKLKYEAESSAECPSGDDPPTFSKNLAIGEIENPANPSVKPAFNLTLSGTNWSISYDGNEYCKYGWTLIMRSDGPVCLQFYTLALGKTRMNSEQACAKNEATISGFDSFPERSVILAAYSRDATEDDVSLERVYWISGKRKTSCQGENWQTLPGCDSFEAFEFPDTFHSKTGDYTWENGAPFGKECLVIWVNSVEDPSRVGKVRDIDCDIPCSSSFCPIGNGCALPASSTKGGS